MRTELRVLGMVLLACLIFAFSVPGYAAAPNSDIDLKADCLAATVKAIKQEIDRHRQWLEVRKKQGDKQGAAAMEEALARLGADLKKYQAMDAKDYELPSPQETVAWIGEQLRDDPVLQVEGMTKSGPWYHIVGIAGGDYGILKPVAKYRITYYSVYPRSYWNMSSAYIYIAAVNAPDETPETKRIMGEVFATRFSGGSSKLIKCQDYKVYLLPADSAGVRGELLLDSKQSEFDIVVPAAKIRQYPYLEFVSAYGGKTIDLREIKDGEWLDVYLVPNVIVKKPVIYLYPARTMPVEVKHDFKGKLLTTYPEYLDGWTVIASPSGDLLNTRDNRHYQYLFWDGSYDFPPEHYQFKNGFNVKKEDYAAFLRNKLAQIGLNEREINDFIVYWLPEMNQYQNCFVHFRVNDNIDGSSLLAVTPQPQTMLRVFMEFYGFDAWEERPRLPEQDLPSIARKGFTLVEWGGSRLDFLTPALQRKVEPKSLAGGPLAKGDFVYLDQEEDILFYGLRQTGASREWLMRLELGLKARERLQRERPPAAGHKDELAKIAAAVCRVKAGADNGLDVIEQVWLDDNGQILGRSEGGDAWPAGRLASACKQFLKRWLTIGNIVSNPPQDAAISRPGGIEKWLWGIAWDTDINDAKRLLPALGFAWSGGSDAATGDSWLKLGNVPFFGLPCDYKLVWRTGRLTAIDIEAADATALAVDAAYRSIVDAFTAEYGSVFKHVSYTLKIFPPIWVDSASWVIKPDNGPAFTVTVGQRRQSPFPDPAAVDAPGKLKVSFNRLVGDSANIE